MSRDTKKVTEAREVLAEAIKEQELKRDANREKREAKFIDKCFLVTNLFNRESKTYYYITGKSQRYRRSYLDVEVVVLTPKTITISKRSYDLRGLEKMAKKEIPYEEFIKYKRNAEVAVDAAYNNKSVIL